MSAFELCTEKNTTTGYFCRLYRKGQWQDRNHPSFCYCKQQNSGGKKPTSYRWNVQSTDLVPFSHQGNSDNQTEVEKCV